MAGKLTSKQARELSARRKTHKGGAPTKLVIIARQKFIEDKKAEFERSFATMIAIQDNPFVSPDTRLKAAIAIQERVEGKAKERNENSGEITIRVIHVGDTDTATGATSLPAPDQDRGTAV